VCWAWGEVGGIRLVWEADEHWIIHKGGCLLVLKRVIKWVGSVYIVTFSAKSTVERYYAILGAK